MKESDASTESTCTTSAEDETTSKDWSSEDGVKSRNKKTVSSKREESIEKENDSNLNSESSDTVDGGKNKTEPRRKSIVTVISDEDILMNELLVSSGESLEINYRIDRRSHDTPTIISSPKHSKVIVKSESEYNINSMVCNDYLNVFGSPRRDLRSSHLSTVILYLFICLFVSKLLFFLFCYSLRIRSVGKIRSLIGTSRFRFRVSTRKSMRYYEM